MWDNLSLVEKRDRVLSLFTITKEQKQEILNEWKTGYYEDTVRGETRSLVMLQNIARDMVIGKEDVKVLRSEWLKRQEGKVKFEE